MSLKLSDTGVYEPQILSLAGHIRVIDVPTRQVVASWYYFTEMCSGSEAGSYSRLIDFSFLRLIDFKP